jgi:DUF971 family protein
MSVPALLEIRLRARSRLLELAFADGQRFALPAEYLRVHSPSAEVRGHGVETGVLVTAKEAVNIRAVEPVGQYAVRLVFDDGHDTGLYTWKYLYELGTGQPALWDLYLQKLKVAGYVRRPAPPPESGPRSGAPEKERPGN